MPLRETGGGGALETVECAIYTAMGLRMRMIEKPFYEHAEGGTDLSDTTVETGPRGVILRRLVEPRPLDGVPTRPPPRPMPAQVRPTASEAALKAAAAARAAAATAKAAQDDAIAAAAAVADATLEHRQTDTAEVAALREARELVRRQAEDEMDAMIANGLFDGGAGEQLSMSGPDDPATHISQVSDDAESSADDEPDHDLDAGRI